MLYARANFRLLKSGEHVYAIGGAGDVKNVNEKFDFGRNTWQSAPATKFNINFTDAFVHEDKIVAVGSNLIMLQLVKDSFVDYKPFNWMAHRCLHEPRLVTPVGANIIVLANEKSIFAIDLKNSSLKQLFNTQDTPVSIAVNGSKLEVVDSRLASYFLDLSLNEPVKAEAATAENKPPALDEFFSAALSNPVLAGAEISISHERKRDSSYFLVGYPEPKLLEFRADGSTHSHCVSLNHTSITEHRIISQSSTGNQIMFVTNAHLGVYDVQANTCNSKHLTETYAFQSRYTHVGPKGIIGIQKDAFEK